MAMQSELPSTYRRVEWIGGDGGQYIATDYTPKIGDEIATEFLLSPVTGAQAIFSAGTDSYQLILLYYPKFFVKYFATGGAKEFVLRPITNMKYRLYINSSGEIYINERLKETSTPIVEIDGANNTLWILRRRNNTSGMSGTIGQFRVTNLGNSKLDLIPCIRKFDSKPGMYDTVSKTFYTNAGTGEFIVPA